nr:uncharacterized protein LOC113806473 [Penaeus vannamei]
MRLRRGAEPEGTVPAEEPEPEVVSEEPELEPTLTVTEAEGAHTGISITEAAVPEVEDVSTGAPTQSTAEMMEEQAEIIAEKMGMPVEGLIAILVDPTEPLHYRKKQEETMPM